MNGNWADDPRLMLGLLGGLGLGEAIVALAFSMPLGVGLAMATGGLAIVGKARERAARNSRSLVDVAVDDAAMFIDPETGLPNRTQLIDQLAREIARSERYQHDLTLAVVEIERMDDIEAAWGGDATTRAVAHVAQTMRRVTRTSDFLSRLDDQRFAVALMKCSNDQAKRFAERVELAVSNRPIRPGSRMRGVPVYLTAKVTTLQFDRTRLRGPLDFLSRAGGELVVQPEGKLAKGARPQAATAAPAQRREVSRDYYPDGKAEDFADAYKSFRGRRAG